MENTKNKGQRAEKELQELLRSLDYTTYRPPWHKYGRKDVFGMFDIVAIWHIDVECSSNTYSLTRCASMVFAQVKTTASGFSKAKKQLKEWLSTKPTVDDVLFAVYWRKKKGVWKWWGNVGNYKEEDTFEVMKYGRKK